MARKSRKNQPANTGAAIPARKIWVAGGYVRLSADDRRKKGDSIAIQRSMIDKFVDENSNVRLHDFYCDNAKSGTSFERPAFKRMLEDAEKGIINCIIVKDLSRFGRNAIDAGYYIERHLPKLNIRFIALNDGFDSNDGDGGIAIPLKNIVNEAYALDISRKCRAVHRANIEAGKFVGRLPPYGYLKDPSDRFRLVVNEDTAPVVRQMFQWAKEGCPPNEISRRLNDSGVLPPSRDRREKGHIVDETPVGRYWTRTTVASILCDRMYIGDMTQGKTHTHENKQVQVSPDKWVIVENTHAPIVGRVLFSEVQAILQQASVATRKKRNTAVPFSPGLFKGKIFCGHCGYAMHRHRQNKDNVYWWRCESQHKYSKTACVQVSVKEEDLRSGAAIMLRQYAEMLLGRKVKLCRQAMSGLPDEQQQKTELQRIEQETQKNRGMLKTLFEKLMRGEIDSAAFAAQKKAYEQRMGVLTQRLLEMESSPREIDRRIKECWELADCMEAAACKYDLTVELLDRFIEKILVWHDKSFEIVWRFQNPFEDWGNIQWAM